MKTEKLKEFKNELELWVDFNSKSPMTLLDISQLLSIIRRYYIIRAKWERKKKNKQKSKK